MNNAGAVMVAAGGDAVCSQLRSMLRYQFNGPVNPLRVNSST